MSFNRKLQENITRNTFKNKTIGTALMILCSNIFFKISPIILTNGALCNYFVFTHMIIKQENCALQQKYFFLTKLPQLSAFTVVIFVCCESSKWCGELLKFMQWLSEYHMIVVLA